MMHYTLTGQYAGQTFCGASREEEGFRGVHPRGDFTAEFFQKNDVCPVCREIWEEALGGEEN